MQCFNAAKKKKREKSFPSACTTELLSTSHMVFELSKVSVECKINQTLIIADMVKLQSRIALSLHENYGLVFVLILFSLTEKSRNHL